MFILIPSIPLLESLTSFVAVLLFIHFVYVLIDLSLHIPCPLLGHFSFCAYMNVVDSFKPMIDSKK